MKTLAEEAVAKASCWERERQLTPLRSSARLGQQGNYIIWRWNESTLHAKVSEMLYCSRNCQLKSNTWNAEARLKQPHYPKIQLPAAPPRPQENVFLSLSLTHLFQAPALFVEKVSTMHLHIGKALCVLRGINKAYFPGLGMWHGCKVNRRRARCWERKQWWFSLAPTTTCPT